MTTHNSLRGFRLMPLAAALLAAFGNAQAQESPEVQELTKPQSSVSLGIGGVNNAQDAKRFGQYTGMNKSGAYGLFDLDLVRLNEASGTWTTLQGRNIGLDTTELSFSQQKQGDWRYAFEYNEIVRNDPYTIHTGMTGIGTTSPTVNLIALPSLPAYWVTANPGLSGNAANPGSDISLKLKRDAFGVSGEKWISPELMFEASFRNEDKKGARMFGRVGINSNDMSSIPTIGTGAANGNWAVLLTPEPINSTIRQFEAKLNFKRDQLALTGGYYGSFYINNFGSLSPIVPGTLNRGALWNGNSPPASTIQQIASSAVALPPDNQAHQLYLTGNWGISPTTRANFKLSYMHATQNASFTGDGLTPSAPAPGSLNGVVNTKLALVGLTMRPSKALSINASLRYEDRDDQTAVSVYNTATSSGLNNTTNWASGSQTRTTAKLEGIYRLPDGYLATLGADWERKKTPNPPANTAIFANQVFFRPVLDEYGVRGELRRAMTENVSGAIGIEYKQRRGKDEDWVTTQNVAGQPVVSVATTGVTSTLPILYMDRNRTKVQGSVDWSPLEQLSLQALVSHAQDTFNRSGLVAGARYLGVDTLNLEGVYTLSEKWRLSAYWTRGVSRWNVNKSSIYDDIGEYDDTFGLSVKGQLNGRMDVGADLQVSRDTQNFMNANINGSAVAGVAGGPGLPGNYLPKIHYDLARLNLFAKYALEKNADLRADLIFQHFKTDDWQWGYNGVPFLYSDNTTVFQPQSQNLLFLGLRYVYKFQ